MRLRFELSATRVREERTGRHFSPPVLYQINEIRIVCFYHRNYILSMGGNVWTGDPTDRRSHVEPGRTEHRLTDLHQGPEPGGVQLCRPGAARPRAVRWRYSRHAAYARSAFEFSRSEDVSADAAEPA